MSAVQFILIGDKSSPRIEAFCETLTGLRMPEPKILSYFDLIEEPACLQAHLDSSRTEFAPVIRIESPGKDLSLERALLNLGIEKSAAENYTWIDEKELKQLALEKGRILAPRQWYLGFSAFLQLVLEQTLVSNFKANPESIFMNHPSEIAVMFDKPACQKLFDSKNIRVPMQLGEITSFEHLRFKMRAHDCNSVFLKLAHGSSGSGMVAYRYNDISEQAATTVETVKNSSGLQLFNTRRVRTLSNFSAITELVDELCRHRAFAEEWVPKATFQSSSCDLRVLTVNQKAKHIVLRKSKTPFTNLHLLNERAEFEPFRKRMGEENWNAAIKTCENVAACFPHSLYTGIDLLVQSGMRKHFIAEANAFGDLLKGVLFNGQTSYAVEIESLLLQKQGACIS